MPRYIDADSFLEKYGGWYTEEGTEEGFIGTIKGLVDAQPTLSPDDVGGVGKWKQKEIINLEDTTIEQMQSACCSACGKYHTTPFSYYFTEYNYCPNCGARMEVSDDA